MAATRHHMLVMHMLGFLPSCINLFLVNGPYWIGYDDLDSIKLKSQFINYRNLGGALIFSLDTDDFRGDYSEHKFPMTMVRPQYQQSQSTLLIAGSAARSFYWRDLGTR